MARLIALFLLSYGLVRAQNTETTLIFGGIVDDVILHGTNETRNAKQIYIVQKGAKRILWQNDYPIQNPSLSPNGKYVAFVSRKENARGLSSLTLKLVNMKGELKLEIEGGVKYSWSYKGDKLAFVKGVPSEEGEGYRPIGAEILDLATESTLNISVKTYDLCWSQFDDQIYYVDYQTGEVRSYDPITGESTSTTFKGIYFSSSGDYYYRPNYEGGGFGLFTKENVDITDRFFEATGAIYPTARWIDGFRLLIRDENLKRNHNYINIIYDLRTNKVTKFEGKVIGSSGKRTIIGIVTDDGSVVPKDTRENY